jgi:hypothetical protein
MTSVRHISPGRGVRAGALHRRMRSRHRQPRQERGQAAPCRVGHPQTGCGPWPPPIRHSRHGRQALPCGAPTNRMWSLASAKLTASTAASSKGSSSEVASDSRLMSMTWTCGGRRGQGAPSLRGRRRACSPAHTTPAHTTPCMQQAPAQRVAWTRPHGAGDLLCLTGHLLRARATLTMQA